jgi:hypothetical protein
VSAPPPGADRDRWARLLAAAEIARRGGRAREVRRAGRPRLAVAGRDGAEVEVRVTSARADAASPETGATLRIVVEAGAEEAAFYLLPADADAGTRIEPWRDRWDLLGL